MHLAVFLLLRRTYGLSQRAYRMLRRLLVSGTKEGWFDANDIPLYRHLSQVEESFPQLPLYQFTVPHKYDPDKTVEVGIHSLFDIATRILQFPGNFERMTFNAVHQPEFSKEMWHGSIFRESPLYTFHKCSNDRSTFSLGENVVYEHVDDTSGQMEQRLGRIVGICALDPDEAQYTELCKTKTISEALEALRADHKLMVHIRPYLKGPDDHELIADLETSVELLDLNSLLQPVQLRGAVRPNRMCSLNGPKHHDSQTYISQNSSY